MMCSPAILQELQSLLDSGQLASVEERCREYLAGSTSLPAVWYVLGVACHRQRKLPQALEAFAKAAHLDPVNAQAHAAHAAALLEAGRHLEALQACRAALAVSSKAPQLQVNLGVVQESLGDLVAALGAYDAALALDPGFAAALMNRGLTLTRLGRLEEALDNNLRLAMHHPHLAHAYFNCAEVLLALGRSQQALAAAERAVALAPDHVKAHIDRALALSELGRFPEAEAAFAEALSREPFALNQFLGLSVDGDARPVRADPRSIYLERAYQRQSRCHWAGRDEYLANFASFVLDAPDMPLDPGLMPLCYHSLSQPVGHQAAAILVRRIATGFSRGAGDAASHRLPRAAGQHIRLGYLSPDFRMHPVGLLTQDLFGLHDRSRFRVFAYSLAPDDGSDVRRRIVAGVDTFRDVSNRSDDAIARHIVDDGIDVLVDLAGYTDLARSGVFARRPAGVQVNYLGYAGSLGATYIDYAIVDPVVCPAGADQYWTEKLVRLPTVFSPAGSREIPAHPARRRADLGLPASGFVFCCFANSYKIDPSLFEVWMRILTRVPDACLWLTLSHPEVESNLKREAQARGVEQDRLVFAPRENFAAYMARYRLADLFLDTRWFNAHTTAIDALRSGVPVLTLAGETMSSRLGASLLNAAALPESITRSLEEYEARAVELASVPDLHRVLRQKVQASVRSSALFDTRSRARELEAAYTEMVSRRHRGLPPASFAVNARPSTPAWF